MKKRAHWRYSKGFIQIENFIFSHVLKHNTERLYKFIKKKKREREKERENQEKTLTKTFVPKQFTKACRKQN